MDSSHRFGEISYLSRQAANDAGQKASVPAFLRCLFLCRFAAGGNQHVSTEILTKICTVLDCDFCDIIELVKEENHD